MNAKKFFVGIDFGTFKTSIAGSNGHRATLPTAVGWPKDELARAVLGSDVVFGERIAEDELALNVVRPFAKGLLKYVPRADISMTDAEFSRHRDAARLVLEHAVSLVEAPKDAPIYAVIGAPSRATIHCKQVIIDAANGAFDGLAIVAEPFTVAYSLRRLRNTLVVDIGAGTVDICPLFGTYPREEDQVTLPIGGDAIDEAFYRGLLKENPQAQVTVEMVREIKERSGFVHDVNESAIVSLPVDGVPTEFDVTEILKSSCAIIVEPIVSGIRQVIARTHPKFQQTMLNNILLGGGGSQLKGLDLLVEDGLAALGGGKVQKVKDSLYAGAVGALQLALTMPEKGWETISRNSVASTQETTSQKAAA